MGRVRARERRRVLFHPFGTIIKTINGMISQVEVLLVEDNSHDAEMTIRSLKKVNLANNLVHVRDGEEALEFIFGQGKFAGRDLVNTPKVILLDIKMPKVDGIEVLRRLKTDEATRCIPVVIMTSSKEEQDVIHSYAL